MKTQYLSKEEREQGIKYFFIWAMLNGLAFSFLGDTTVYLMAMHFGASNLQLGYISSFVHVSGVVLLFIPYLFKKINFITILFYSWLFRGLVCVGYAVLWFFTGRTAVIIILLLYSLFCLVRTFGMAIIPPIQQMLSTSSTTGELVVRMSIRFQTARFLSQFLSFLLLSIQQLTGITGYLVLMVMGIITNTLGTFSLKHIPCREVVEFRKGQNIFRIFQKTLRNKERVLTLFVKWHALGLMIIFAFMIPFLRKLALFPPNFIFLYTLTGTLATISAGYILRPFTDRVGSRPVLIMVSFFLLLVAILWCIIPTTTPWAALFLLGFLTFFLQAILFLLTSRLELKAIPQKDKIGYVSMVNFSAALIALGVGLLAGWLADLGEQIIFPGINPFGLTFFLAVILAMQTSILSFFLEDAGSLSVRDTALILFSTRNLKAFLNIYQMHMTDDPNKRKAILLSIGKSDTFVAVDEMRRIFRNPLSTEKEEMLKSLFAYPKPSLVKEILWEASDEHSYHRATALFALGAYPTKKVEELLLSLLDHPLSNIRSTAAKSLARIGNTTALDRIQQQAADPSLDLWARMNYLIAISLMDKKQTYLKHLFEMADHNQETSFEQTMFALTARMLDFEPALSELYQEENLERTSGLRMLLEETRQLQPFFEDFHRLLEWYTQEKYQKIWEWCRTVLEQGKFTDRFPGLQQAINTYDIRYANKENTFAALYFLYQIMS